jgi:transposase-like protein
MNISYPTIRRWYKRLRQYLPIDTLGKLSGVVEVDESYFGKKRYSNQVIVIGAIERDTKRLKLRMVANTEQPTLERFVLDNVEPGSLVMTDCHGGYNDLNFLGYNHEVWNHSRGHYAGTNQIEGTWSAMKRHMRKLYGNVPTDDMQLILNEWVARHNQPELFEDPRTYLKVVLLPS